MLEQYIKKVAVILLIPTMFGSSSYADTTFVSSSAGSMLCSEDKTICVPLTIENSLITNPFTIRINPKYTISWVLSDSTGQEIESASSDEYVHYPDEQGSVAINDYVIRPAKSDHGYLVISLDNHEDPDDSISAITPKLNIPVRLNTDTTLLTIMSPKNEDLYNTEVLSFINAESVSGKFVPKTPFIKKYVKVMKIDNKNDIMKATIEVILRIWPGQAPQHVKKLYVEDGMAHVKIDGNGWAGISAYLNKVYPIIEQSLLQFPGVEKVAFE